MPVVLDAARHWLTHAGIGDVGTEDRIDQRGLARSSGPEHREVEASQCLESASEFLVEHPLERRLGQVYGLAWIRPRIGS